MKKLVRESLQDKLSGPSKEDMLNKIEGMDPDKALRSSAAHSFIEGVLRSLERGGDFDTGYEIVLRKFNKDQIERLKEILRKRGERDIKELLKYTLRLGNVNRFFSKSEISEFKKELEEEGDTRMLLRLAVLTKDYQLIDKYRERLPKGYENIEAEELPHYVTPDLRYPRGYTLYHILNFIKENQPVRYTDIIKFIVEFKGETYTREHHRGYYATSIQDAYDHYFDKRKDGYYLSNDGALRLQELDRKFKKKYPKLVQ